MFSQPVTIQSKLADGTEGTFFSRGETTSRAQTELVKYAQKTLVIATETLDKAPYNTDAFAKRLSVFLDQGGELTLLIRTTEPTPSDNPSRATIVAHQETAAVQCGSIETLPIMSGVPSQVMIIDGKHMITDGHMATQQIGTINDDHTAKIGEKAVREAMVGMTPLTL